MVVSSRQVAEHFGKRHAHVIDAIEKHIEDLHSAEKSVQWFYVTHILTEKAKVAKST